MLEERARLVAWDERHLWLAVRRRPRCAGCRGRCLQGLMASSQGDEDAHLSLPRSAVAGPLVVGETFLVGITEQGLLRASLRLYLLPLLGLLAGALLADGLGAPEPSTLAAALAGLFAGAAAVRAAERRHDPGVQVRRPKPEPGADSRV